MPRSSRFPVALHILEHLAVRLPEPMTSGQLAACVGTNPVVVRRTLAGLRTAGIVTAARGQGGGWALTRAPADVTLHAVYVALGERLLPTAETAGRSPACCVIPRAVDGALAEVLEDAEAHLAGRLARITLADLAARVRALAPPSPPAHDALRLTL